MDYIWGEEKCIEDSGGEICNKETTFYLLFIYNFNQRLHSYIKHNNYEYHASTRFDI